MANTIQTAMPARRTALGVTCHAGREADMCIGMGADRGNRLIPTGSARLGR